MKDITEALKAHLSQPVTTLATCWKADLQFRDVPGKTYTFTFTDHTRDIQYKYPYPKSELLGNFIYKASGGFIPSAVEATSGLNVDNLEIEAILDSPLITEADLMAGMWDYADITVFVVNYEDLTMGPMIVKRGRLGQVSIKQQTFVAEIRGLSQQLQNVVGESYTPLCRARLGDARCRVDMTAFTKTGTVFGVSADNRTINDPTRTEEGPTGGFGIASISRALRAVVTTTNNHTFGNGDSIFLTGVNGVVQAGAVNPATGIMEAGSGRSVNGYTYGIWDVTPNSFSIPLDTRYGSSDNTAGPSFSEQFTDYASGGIATPEGQVGYFDYGTIRFTSGKNQGYSMEVKAYSPGVIELQLPMPFPIGVGDTYVIQAGCGKRFTQDCKNKFNNVVNFRGEPHLPGVDAIVRVGSRPV